MPKSYRIRTSTNQSQEQEQTIRVQVDQDFDFLEILSLKLTQSEVYQRFCSDYGVIVGRVVANGGYGVPNAKISVFVPIDDVDLNDPIISTLYPYRAPSEKNEDGFRYNLLPYEPSYEGHSATGTFPSRDDVMSRKEVLHIYEKYYKYTVRTNESGDYMIVGVPLGNQQIVMDLDLSDMGCFSLRPTDLIRMNLGVAEQFNGNEFKSSDDLDSLPQILNLRKTAYISPFWGVGDACDIGINRMDFDLRDANVDIQPTSTFMGSIFTSSDSTFLRKNCKPATEQGDLCGLTTGPGRILALRQTINRDENGLPILEEHKLPSGGKVIDDDGTFVVDVPMNLDYVVTDEFGQLVFSNNPKIGIPTRGKYRFKVKYNDSEKDITTTTFNPNTIIAPQILNLSAFRPKGNLLRGSYLIPNIKEYGWENGDPNTTENSVGVPTPIVFDSNSITEEKIIILPSNKVGKIESITEFEGLQIFVNDVLDNSKWIESQDVTQPATVRIVITKKVRKVVSGNTVIDEPIPVNLNFVTYNYSFIQFQKSYSFSLDWDDYANIDDALNCHDIFYEFNYNKVYTTAQLIDEYRSGTARGRFLSIKEILERSCDSETNKFPINDGVRNFDLLYFIISILFLINSIAFPILIITYDILKILWEYVIKYLVFVLVYIISFIVDIVGFISYLFSPNFARRVRGFARDIRSFASSILDYQFPAIKLPMLTYPDCSTCDCGDDNFGEGGQYTESNQSVLADVNTPTIYERNQNIDALESDQDQYEQEYFNELYGQLAAGRSDADDKEWGRTPKFVSSDDTIRGWITGQLPIPERINMFNGKGKYFNTTVAGGVNRIKVYPNYSANTISISQTDPITYQFYEDQPYVMLIDPETVSIMTTGQMVSFIDIDNSNDINISGTTSITGITPTTGNIVKTISYANPNNPNENIDRPFILVNNLSGTTDYVFASDIEYQQVITATTIGNIEDIIDGGSYNDFGFFKRIINGYILPQGNIREFNGNDRNNFTLFGFNEPIKTIPNYRDIGILILMKGVDPYSTRQRTKIDISLTMGLSEGTIVVENDYKINVPIQSGLSLPKHNQLTVNDTIFYPSSFFTPSTSGVNSFSSYTTNLHTYYSSYDNSTDGNGVNNEKIGSNVSGYYVATENTPGRWLRNRIVSGVDGYYDGEYVEGVSLMTNLYAEPTRSDSFVDGGFFKFESTVYNTGSTINVNNSSNIIIRTDRLPRSDQFDGNYVMSQNKSFGTYLVSDDGTSVQLVSIASTSDFSTSQSGDFQDVYGSGTTSLISSFSCNTMVPLDAYNTQVEGSTISVKNPNDPSYYIDGDTQYPKMQNGCYVISEKLFAIGSDLQQFSEWKSRFILNFAICRNVFGMTFTNQWVNGGLYLPGFQNDVIYPGIEVTNPTYEFCNDKIVYRIENNSFFYRSSPYTPNGGFVGKQAQKVTNIFGTQEGNNYFLGSPTTIVDLGPKDNIIQNVCAQPEFQGYGMDRLSPTSFNSPGDLLQLFIISRLSNSTFLQRIFTLGSASVGQFFSREDGEKIDGDFAQLVSINSEIGVTPFSPETYSDNSTYFGLSVEPVMGVFFTGNTQVRDYISPGRTTFIDTPTKFGYNTYSYRTQTVPMYKWKRVGGNNIFGTENNTWVTNPPFYSEGYQNIDRLNDNTYFQSNIKTPTTQRPGYIYNSQALKDSNGSVTGFTYDATIPTGSEEFIVGAPYHFYFGLKRGRTAFDKFLKNNLIE